MVLLSLRKEAAVGNVITSQLTCETRWCILLFRGGNSKAVLVFPFVMEGPEYIGPSD